MARKQMAWKTKGMNRDLSVSAFNPEFAFENRNLRLGTNEANTSMSWVTEKGTKLVGLRNVEYWSKRFPNSDYTSIVYEDPNDSSWTHHSGNTEDVSIIGTPIGTAVINHQLVVFTTDVLHEHDYIYVLYQVESDKDSLYCKTLFGYENQSIGFSVEHPLETLVSYESEMIQKVYWTDGINQPRVVNIKGKIRHNNVTQFDFVPTLQLRENVTVTKTLGANGLFAPGVIQYALTYYNKYAQESNIFYVSPLMYISFNDRGASPEEKVENAFKITVKNVDQNFDYLRIYSIQRTSVNATPICKRVQDILIDDLEEDSEEGLKASYTDTGMSGDSIDPTELLYKGGEVISAYTMNQKDGTLFLGNLSITRPQINVTLKDLLKLYNPGYNPKGTKVEQDTREINALSVSTGSYVYSNQLTSFSDSTKEKSVPCGGFKHGDVYRLGVQFQYETGKWSDPIWVGDVKVENKPELNEDNTVITLPTLKGVISPENVATLVEQGYKRVRGLVVFPKIQDRNILCQGVVNPTLWTQEHRNNGDLEAQSSWFFRAYRGRKLASDYSASPADTDGNLPYTHMGIGTGVPKSGCTNYNPSESATGSTTTNNIRLVEIQGEYNDSNKFKICRDYVTFHSPDIEFDNQLSLTDYSNGNYRQVGYAKVIGTMADIEIQTETPTVSSQGSGFVHKSFKESGNYGIVSGLFYDDFIADEDGSEGEIHAYPSEKSSCKWLVYLWNRTGALNNDFNRPSTKGSTSAYLKKKVISNLRYANTYYRDYLTVDLNYAEYPRIFNFDEVGIVKLGDKIYKGNIDTSIIPDEADGDYFAFENESVLDNIEYTNTPFSCNKWWKTFSKKPSTRDNAGLYKYKSSGWQFITEHIGDYYLDLAIKKSPVRMKYKSSAHLVFKSIVNDIKWETVDDCLPIIEIRQNSSQVADTKRFGGQTPDAFRENIWIPCGEPELLTTSEVDGITFRWSYGDTYFQRWDCLKTYAFTREDPNQVVEIGSFMLETRINIDGRYDRNRGQLNNLNMSPINFNLLNPVYTQTDNFFQYRIQDDDYYTNVIYPNQITWAVTKQSGAGVDAWTTVTMASTLELDGDKGKIVSLQKYNNQLLCFQDTSFSRISYNETYQITTTEGVPVEIANSGKVQGKNYISDTVGCSNKWSIVNGTMGLYFMDSIGKDIYLFNGQLTNLSMRSGFNAWCKLYIPSDDVKWTPIFPIVDEKSPFVAHFDKINRDILFINHRVCLAYSEKFGTFTSFYDYHNTPFFCNLDDMGIWLRSNQVWKHQAGNYCNFFGAPRPYSMVLVGNPEPLLDKIFTNIEFRACVDAEGDYKYGTYRHYLPFDSLDTWDEYQHGMAYLNNMRGHSAMEHHTLDNEASLKRRFRIWRCDIPRDNGDNLDTFDETFDDTFHPLARDRKHPLDRMRNPWLYIRLRNSPDGDLSRTEIHDVVMTYFV